MLELGAPGPRIPTVGLRKDFAAAAAAAAAADGFLGEGGTLLLWAISEGMDGVVEEGRPPYGGNPLAVVPE